MTRRRASTLTARLTVLHACGFLVASLAMTLLTYLLVRWTFSDEATRDRAVAVLRRIAPGWHDPMAISRVRETLGVEPDELLRSVAADARNDATHSMLTWSLAMLSVTAVVFTVGSWWMSRRALRPLRSMADAAARMTADDLRRPLTPDGRSDDEVGRLADAFDGAFARIDGVFETQRNFASAVAHELRTPLTVLRAEAELTAAAPAADRAEAADRLIATAIGTVEQTTAVVDALLALARAEAGGYQPARCDVAEIVGDVVGRLAPLADRQRVELELALEELQVVADPVLLEVLAANLVKNAIVHNVPGGRARVEVRTDGRLTVDNTGPRLSADEVAQLGQPFVRARTSGPRPPGHGIGLTVVETIVRALHTSLHRAPLPDGGLVTVVQFSPGPGTAA